MKFLYPTPKLNAFILNVVKTAIGIIFLVAGFYSVANAQTSQELVFKNPVLTTGTDGADNAVYRFPAVMNGIDALVKINGRSSSEVRLVSLDLTNTGFDKAFQPQVTYGANNTVPAGNTDFWMEFQVSFVQANTNTAAVVSSFNVTGLDIDGNGDKLSEYQTYYGLHTFTLENSSVLHTSVVKDLVAGIMTNVAERFDGPVTNYAGIDTSATKVMATSSYVGTNSFKVRTGAKSNGPSAASDRMYSLWFKAFSFQQPVISFLPVTLINWNAAYANNSIALTWTTTEERNASHFILERSFDGVEYADVAMLFAVGNSDISNNYSYNDKVGAANSGIIYYRLKMVDMDGRYKTSDIRIVRLGKAADGVKILAYPNPVVSDVRITIPQSWQGKQISYQLTNANGQTIKSYTVQYASQTEVIAMTQVPAGMYIMRVTNGNETAVQAVVKSAR